MELYTTQLSIYEIGVSQTPDIFKDQQNGRIECLWSSMNAVKSWIDIFLSIIPAEYIGFSILVYSNIAHCFVGLYQLSIFEHPEWDRALFREHLNISSILDHCEKNFSRVKEEAGLDISGSEVMDSFSSMGSRIRAFKLSWGASNSSTVGPSSQDELYDFPMPDFSDQDWLRDLLGPWNE